MLRRAGDLLTGLLAFSLGSVMAWHYPLGQVAALALFLGASILAFYRLSWFLVILPAMLPVIGLAPWTGWITFEEVDLLVLAMASGGYTRALIAEGQADSRRRPWLLTGFSFLMAVSILTSMARGFSDAGGFDFGWFQGYDGPMNSIRIGKSFFLALLLVPLLRRLQRDPAQESGRKLAWGMALGLGSASLAALWERLAFTDLLNFSSDYRSTALFWEMHVGGAALDGWLLLTVPFAIWVLRNARSMLQHAIAILLVVVAAYAALTTFSRGVYLALIVALALLAWQTRTHASAVAAQPEQLAWGPLHWSIAQLALGAMAFLVFPGGGYRGLMALLGCIAVALSMPMALRHITVAQLVAGTLVGVVLGVLLVLMAGFIPKGAYLLYALICLSMLAVLHWFRAGLQGNQRIYCTAGFIALTLATANVADHWGGSEALWGMIAALSVVVALAARGIFATRPVWSGDLRWQATFMSSALAVCAVVAVFVGGGYMSERFSTSEQDLDDRFDHWTLSTSMLQTPLDVAFGKGLGRYPANYFFAIPDSRFPGTYRIVNEGGASWLSMVGARHPMSFGDIFRVSQRLGFDVEGPFDVSLRLRSRNDISVHFEVCEKHLLYVAGCAIGKLAVKGNDGAWQEARLRLNGPLLSGGSWYVPKMKMFSLGIYSQSRSAEIDDLMLSSAGGENLLGNGDFANGMQQWFFSSDRDHMPWHAKNILVNVLFDQGVMGLALFLLLTAAAFWRLNFSKARHYEYAPYISAALLGFLVVGMFDSLMDVPRVALVYYLLILHALSFGKLRAGSGR